MFLKMLIYFFQFQDSEPQTCSKCNKNIVGLVNLMDHFNKDHGLIDNQWQCPICPKNFKDRIGAWRHVRADHLNIMKKCHECGVSLPLRKFKHHKNKKHGKGVYQWPDGRKYEGEWVDGRISGQGRANIAPPRHRTPPPSPPLPTYPGESSIKNLIRRRIF